MDELQQTLKSILQAEPGFWKMAKPSLPAQPIPVAKSQRHMCTDEDSCLPELLSHQRNNDQKARSSTIREVSDEVRYEGWYHKQKKDMHFTVCTYVNLSALSPFC